MDKNKHYALAKVWPWQKIFRNNLNFFIRLLLEYADVIWDNCTQPNKNELEGIQLEAARISTG